MCSCARVRLSTRTCVRARCGACVNTRGRTNFRDDYRGELPHPRIHGNARSEVCFSYVDFTPVSREYISTCFFFSLSLPHSLFRESSSFFHLFLSPKLPMWIFRAFASRIRLVNTYPEMSINRNNLESANVLYTWHSDIHLSVYQCERQSRSCQFLIRSVGGTLYFINQYIFPCVCVCTSKRSTIS